MEDNHNNNKKKNYPSIPSNYVTLLQLQEKWLKGKEKQKQQQQQEQQQLLKVEEQSIKPRRRNRKTVEKAVVAANESAEKEVNSEELSSSSSSSKKKKKKGNNGRKKKKEETQSRAKEEEEVVVVVVGGDAHAPPVSTEKENVSVRRVWLKKEMRPKTDNVVLVQTEGLETDRKFRDLSMKQSSSEGLEGGNVVVIHPKFRDLSMNNPSEGVKNYRINRGVRRGDLGYNGNGGGGYRRVGGYQGEQMRMRSGPGPGPGVVWVKKGEIVDGNQSSSSSVKQLE